MAEWLERKYIGLVSSQLRNFKWTSNNTARCSCPLCGDSQKNKFKARFYFLQKDNRFNVFCHNCGASMAFTGLLKQQYPEFWVDYNKELLLEKYGSNKPKTLPPLTFSKPNFLRKESPLSSLKKISQLDDNHPAKRYVLSRKIPNNYHYKIFFTDNFAKWVNHIIPNKIPNTKSESRIVIPFLDRNNQMFAFQGRIINNNQNAIRYVTISVDSNKPTIFGLDTVDMTQQYYILEGPIDSMFVDNAIAMAGSSNSVDLFNSENGVFVYDNEPRNKEIVAKIESAIEKNFKVVIWPKHINCKDINDLVLSGVSRQTIMDTLISNTYLGLTAKLKLVEWKKV